MSQIRAPTPSRSSTLLPTPCLPRCRLEAHPGAWPSLRPCGSTARFELKGALSSGPTPECAPSQAYGRHHGKPLDKPTGSESEGPKMLPPPSSSLPRIRQVGSPPRGRRVFSLDKFLSWMSPHFSLSPFFKLTHY